MNQSAGYKACLDVPNVNPEHALSDCIADIQVSYYVDAIIQCNIRQTEPSDVSKYENSLSTIFILRKQKICILHHILH